MKKKLRAVLLTAVLGLSLTACAGNSQESTSADSQTPGNVQASTESESTTESRTASGASIIG